MAVLNHTVDGETYTVMVDCPSYLDGAALSLAGAAYIGKLLFLRDAGRAAASAALLRSYNETWREEGDEVLDRAGFEAKLTVSSVEVLDTPDHGTVYYSDNGMFMAHRVAVSFSGEKVSSVELLG